MTCVPSLVLPSRNTPMLVADWAADTLLSLPSPHKASAIKASMRARSRGRARSINNVSAFTHSQPTNGQRRTSDLATKRVGTAALMAKISSHDTWFATSRNGAASRSGGAPCMVSCAARWRTNWADQRCKASRRRATLMKGYPKPATPAAFVKCAATRASRQTRVRYEVRGARIRLAAGGGRRLMHARPWRGAQRP